MKSLVISRETEFVFCDVDSRFHYSLI